jgi:hypothetical protein
MAVDRYVSTLSNYVHPQESNLLNIHKAMDYNATGEPVVRVHVDGITLEGDVIVDTVSLSSSTLAALESVSVQNTVTVTVNNFPTTSTVYQGTIPWVTTITNWPALQYVNGVLYAVQSGTWNVNVTSLPAVSGTVAISSLPAVTGTVAVSNFPTSVTVTNFTSTVNIASMPAVSGTVAISSLPAITGTVVVSNFTSTVRVDNFPTSVTVTNFTSTVFVSNTLTISNTSFAVTNFPTTSTVYQGTTPWNITGTVTVNQIAGDPTLVKYSNNNNLQMDMVDRLRVSPTSQMWWYAPTVDKDGDLRYIESITGTNAASTFVQNLASINLTSGTAANGSLIRISRRRHKLRPGISMLASFSINWNGHVPDGLVTKRVGMFTNFNGIFYEMTNDLQIVIRRRLTDGTLVERRIPRTSFTDDKLDGTGATGYDLRPVVKQTANITAHVSTTPVVIGGNGGTVYRVVFTVSDPTQFFVSQKGRITGVTPTLFNGTVMVTAISGSNVTFVYNQDPGAFSSLSSAKFEHTNLHHQYVFGFDFTGTRVGKARFFMDSPLGRIAIHVEDFGDELSTPFVNAPAMSLRYEI